jgi:ABC-type multidrug transport system ATPase subunit
MSHADRLSRLVRNLLDLSRAEARATARALLERFDLTEAADRVAKTYSGGMRRRLDLAAGLVGRPAIIYLDEPTTGLDPAKRDDVWQIVRGLVDDGVTVLLTTQYLEEADALAGRIAIIDNGKIVREGTPAALKAKVGSPTLLVEVGHEQVLKTKAVLERFGDMRPSRAGVVAIGLSGGAAAIPKVARALDDAKITLVGFELHNPSLDDVFADATGHRLEGAIDVDIDEVAE